MSGHHFRWAAFFVLLVVATAAGGSTRRSLAQDFDDDGHSYMRIAIGDHVLTNMVRNDEYQHGWLSVEFILIKLTSQTRALAVKAPGIPKGWELLSAEMKSGHHGPGTLNFGVGDNGGLDPLLEAQKKGTVIASADLDLFPNYGEGRTLIGKYRIKAIRVVDVEDVPASACGMYDVTMRFQSIETRAAQESNVR
jgi:hypothetical protein